MRRGKPALAAVLALAAISIGVVGAQTAAPVQTGEVDGQIDLAALMPPDTIAYLESGSLGRQVETAVGMLEGTPLADPAALAVVSPGGGPGPQQVLAAITNPAMIGEAQKVRGLAVGFQGLSMGESGPEPKVVAVLDLGENNGLRSMLMMGIMMAGAPAGRIEGMDVVKVREPALGGIAYDDRMVIYGRPLEQLEWCVRQHKSGCSGESLLTASPSFGRLDPQTRSNSALAAWVDAERLLPALEFLGGPGARQGLSELATAISAAGVEDFTCRAVLDPHNPFLEATVWLRADEQPPLYEMARTGPLGTDVLRVVPLDAIALVAGGMSRMQIDSLGAQLPVAADSNPFADISHVALFMMPPDPETVMFADEGAALAESLGLAVTIRDGASTEDVVESLRMCVEAVALQAGALINSVDVGERKVEFMLPAGSPFGALHLAWRDGFLVVSLNPDVVGAALESAASGRCALTEGPLHTRLAGLDPAVSGLALGSAGALVSAITAMNNAAIPIDEELAGHLADLASMLEDTCLQLSTVEAPARFTVRADALSLPSVRDAIPVVRALQQYTPPVEPVEPVAVYRAATAIAVDGNAADWAGVEVLAWTGGYGNGGEARIAWRRDGLYGLVTSIDGHVQSNDEAPWTDDGLQAFIETDNARRRGFSDQSRGILLWPTTLTGPGGANIQTEDHGGATSGGCGSDPVSGIQCAWDVTDSGYALEFYVPSSALGLSALEAGSELGLCLFLRDGSVTPAASFCAVEGPDTWQRPYMWGAIRLSTN